MNAIIEGSEVTVKAGTVLRGGLLLRQDRIGKVIHVQGNGDVYVVAIESAIGRIYANVTDADLVLPTEVEAGDIVDYTLANYTDLIDCGVVKEVRSDILMLRVESWNGLQRWIWSKDVVGAIKVRDFQMRIEELRQSIYAISEGVSA